MKKIFFILLFGLFVFASQSQTVTTVKYPFGAATLYTSTDRLTSALSITNNVTYVNYGTLDTNLTITVTATNVGAGATLYIKAAANSTNRTVTLSTGFLGTAQTFTASKIRLLKFFYNGTTFELVSSNQLD